MSKKLKAKKYSLVKGFKDILPEDHFYWDFVLTKFKDVAYAYGFEKIELPILEESGLFVRGVGSDTDIVSKEMFSFETPGKDKVTLRPEGTAGVVRAYVEHGMMNRRKPVKLYYSGPMFRYDKPQAGRYRQFQQIGFEVFGDDDPIIDAQLIFMCYQMYDELNIPVNIQVNSIGCSTCRNHYLKALKLYLKKYKSKLCPDCNKRYNKNVLRILDCKQKKCQEIVAEAPQIVDHLCPDCNKHFVKVLEYLDDSQIPYNLNPFIVRGLDYYNRTAFEVFAKDDDGSQSALGGGGRYDGLVRLLGGAKTPAVGFALGLERTISKLRENEEKNKDTDKSLHIETQQKCDIFVAQLGDEARKKVLVLFEKLRRDGFIMGESISKTALKAQMEDADRLKAKFCLIVGQKELIDDTILIRDMESGNQEIVPSNQLLKVLRRRLESLK